jgi:integrase
MKKRTYGTGTLRQLRSGKWLLEYKPTWSPKRLSKTTSAPNEKVATRLLSNWVTDLDKRSGPEIKVPIEELIELHISDMRMKGREPSSIKTVEQRCKKHLLPYFRGIDFAKQLSSVAITNYIGLRMRERAKRATINRELSALRRAIRLGIAQELIKVAAPKIEILHENNVRNGFVDDIKYKTILHHLPDHQQMLWCFGYRLGIRKGEALKIRVDWVLPYWMERDPYVKVPGFDEQGNRITKSGKPHTIPLYHPELRTFVKIALERRDPKCPYLF